MRSLLIVDDDADIREMIGHYFLREGYEVSYACNGNEGLSLVRTRKFTVILLDIMMPEMDGYTMISKLRTFSDISVILLTAKDAQIDKIKGFTKGCDDYVVKPFDFAELSLRIQAIEHRVYTKKRHSNKILYI